MIKIVVTGLYEDANKTCQQFNKREVPFNFEINGESIISILKQFENRNIQITIESLETV